MLPASQGDCAPWRLPPWTTGAAPTAPAQPASSPPAKTSECHRPAYSRRKVSSSRRYSPWSAAAQRGGRGGKWVQQWEAQHEVCPARHQCMSPGASRCRADVQGGATKQQGAPPARCGPRSRHSAGPSRGWHPCTPPCHAPSNTSCHLPRGAAPPSPPCHRPPRDAVLVPAGGALRTSMLAAWGSCTGGAGAAVSQVAQRHPPDCLPGHGGPPSLRRLPQHRPPQPHVRHPQPASAACVAGTHAVHVPKGEDHLVEGLADQGGHVGGRRAQRRQPRPVRHLDPCNAAAAGPSSRAWAARVLGGQSSGRRADGCAPVARLPGQPLCTQSRAACCLDPHGPQS